LARLGKTTPATITPSGNAFDGFSGCYPTPRKIKAFPDMEIIHLLKTAGCLVFHTLSGQANTDSGHHFLLPKRNPPVVVQSGRIKAGVTAPLKKSATEPTAKTD